MKPLRFLGHHRPSASRQVRGTPGSSQSSRQRWPTSAVSTNSQAWLLEKPRSFNEGNPWVFEFSKISHHYPWRIRMYGIYLSHKVVPHMMVLKTGWWFLATPLKNMKVNWDDDRNPLYGKIKNGNQTTNQIRWCPPVMWTLVYKP